MESYAGAMLAGLPHGFGVGRGPDGESYAGKWSAGKREGVITEAWPDGYKLERLWKDDAPVDGNGAVYCPDHSTYVGPIIDGVAHGSHGELCLCSGVVYTGPFVDGEAHGAAGLQVLPDGARYIGGFARGRRSGQGVFIFPSGDRVYGQWVDGVALLMSLTCDT